MNHLVRTSSLFACGLLVGCAGPHATGGTMSNWRDAELCAASLDEVTASLAGANAVDCGIAMAVFNGVEHIETLNCGRRASMHRALRLGVAFFGIDSGECTIAVRTEAGNLLRLRYSYDVSVPVRRWLDVERCDALTIAPVMDLDQAVRLDGCVADATESDRLRAMHLQLLR
jgi:hypothetical protein